MLIAARSHGNFVENVPLALLMGAIVEMNGGNRKVLSGSFAALLALRILHVELGLKGKNARGPGRAIGHLGTVGFVVGMAGYAAYLGSLFSASKPRRFVLIFISQGLLGLLRPSSFLTPTLRLKKR